MLNVFAAELYHRILRFYVTFGTYIQDQYQVSQVTFHIKMANIGFFLVKPHLTYEITCYFARRLSM